MPSTISLSSPMARRSSRLNLQKIAVSSSRSVGMCCSGLPACELSAGRLCGTAGLSEHGSLESRRTVLNACLTTYAVQEPQKPSQVYGSSTICFLEQITIIYYYDYINIIFFLEKNSLNFTIYVWWDLVSPFFRIRLKHFGRNFQF